MAIGYDHRAPSPGLSQERCSPKWRGSASSEQRHFLLLRRCATGRRAWRKIARPLFNRSERENDSAALARIVIGTPQRESIQRLSDRRRLTEGPPACGLRTKNSHPTAGSGEQWRSTAKEIVQRTSCPRSEYQVASQHRGEWAANSSLTARAGSGTIVQQDS